METFALSLYAHKNCGAKKSNTSKEDAYLPGVVSNSTADGFEIMADVR